MTFFWLRSFLFSLGPFLFAKNFWLGTVLFAKGTVPNTKNYIFFINLQTTTLISSLIFPKLLSTDSFKIISAIFCGFVTSISSKRYLTHNSLFLYSILESKIPSLHITIMSLFSISLSQAFTWWDGPHIYVEENIKNGRIICDLLKPMELLFEFFYYFLYM